MKTQISVDHWGCKRPTRLLALILALTLAAPVLSAQESNRLRERDRGPDPTGAWLLNWDVSLGVVPGPFVLNVFHEGGTLTGDIQGESAFDPAKTVDPTSDFNVITSPQSGVWQKKGRNKFVATFWVIEYRVLTDPEPASPVFQLSKVQYTGTLTDSGNSMTLKVLVSHYDENGNEIRTRAEFNANGKRITLDGIPLPIPN